MPRLPACLLRAAILALLLLGLAAAPPAGAQIIYDHAHDLWEMNDDGTNQHELIGALSVPGIIELGQPAVDPNGTTLAFEGEWLGGNAESQHWIPSAPGACGVNCEGVYSVAGGVLRRLTAAPIGCPLNPCASFDSNPAVASDGDVLFQFAFYNSPNLCSISSWCVDLVGAALDHEPAVGGARTEIPTPCGTSTMSATAGQPEQVAVNPTNPPVSATSPQQIAFADCHDPTTHDPIVILANRDGSNPKTFLDDDQDFQSVAFTPDGTHLITDEVGGDAGIWSYPLNATPVATDQVLVEPTTPTTIPLFSPREISGHRIAFVAQNNIWTVPDTCVMCTFPASATKLTTTGDDHTLTWTAQTIAAPSPPVTTPTTPVTPVTPVTPISTPPGPNPATTAPTISGFTLSANAFRAAKSGGSIAAKPTGTKISYSDNEPGTTTFVVSKPSKGARKGSKCVKRTRKLRKARNCTRYVAVGSPFKHTDTAGANSFTFTGRVGGKALKPGSYRLVGTPRNASGKVGKPVTSGFRIVP